MGYIMNNKEQGFTLIELMIAIGIVGILAVNALSGTMTSKNVQLAKLESAMATRSENLAAHDDFMNDRTAVDPHQYKDENNHFSYNEFILVGDTAGDIVHRRQYIGRNGDLFTTKEKNGRRDWLFARDIT